MYAKTFLLTSLLCAGPESRDDTIRVDHPAAVSSDHTELRSELRSLGEIRTHVTNLLSEESRTRRLGDNTPAVLQLIDSYLELAADPRRDTSETVRRLGRKLRVRLSSVRDHIQRKLSRAHDISTPKRVRPEAIVPRNDVLAQQLGNPPRGAPVPVPPVIGNPPFGAAGVPVDYGQDLVDLIQRVISPQIWDVNGGPGMVVYFAPLRALVVRAPSEMHHQIGGVLGGLRAAGQ